MKATIHGAIFIAGIVEVESGDDGGMRVEIKVPAKIENTTFMVGDDAEFTPENEGKAVASTVICLLETALRNLKSGGGVSVIPTKIQGTDVQ